MAGGFLGDFVKGRLCGQSIHALEQGIRLHRHIDSYSDRHLALGKLRTLLPQEYRRYSGIVADVVCDHYLSLHWDEFSDVAINEFNHAAICGLRKYRGHFPARASWTFERMARGDWLLNYHCIEFVSGALSRIGRRLNHQNPLHAHAHLLPELCGMLLPMCGEILNDCQVAVAEWRAENDQLREYRI